MTLPLQLPPDQSALPLDLPVDQTDDPLFPRLNSVWRTFVALNALRVPNSVEGQELVKAMSKSAPASQAFLRSGKALLSLPEKLVRWGLSSKSGPFGGFGADSPMAGVSVGELLAGIPDMVAGLVAAPVEAFTGVRHTGTEFEPLTEEERAGAILETVGNVLSIASSLKVHQEFTKREIVRASKIAKGARTPIAAGEEVSKGALKRRALKGAVEAGVGGGVFETIAGAQKDDPFSQALLSGVMFAPIGIAGEVMLGRRPMVKETIAEASKLAHVRYLQATTDDTMRGLGGKLEGLENADDLLGAVLDSKLKIEEGAPFIIPGVQNIASVIKNIAEGKTKITPQFYQRPDGFYDVFVYSADKVPTDRAIKSFRNTGFAPFESVIVDGKPWEFLSASADGTFINLRDGANHSVTKRVKRERVRREPTQIMVYHGTPRVFDEFDPAKFDPNGLVGPGVYLADKPVRALSNYAEGATARSAPVNIQAEIKLLESDLARAQTNLRNAKINLDYYNNQPPIAPEAAHSTIGKTRREVEFDVERHSADVVDLEEALARAQDMLEESKKTHAPNIRIAHINKADMFLFDDPLPPDQFERLNRQAKKEKIDLGIDNWPTESLWGADIYGWLHEGGKPFKNKKELNAFLQRAGFKGIKYDGGARVGGGRELYNAYAIFDPKDVKPGFPRITDDYGLVPEDVGKKIFEDFADFLTGGQANLLDATPDLPFNKILEDFAKSRGFSRRELPALEKAIDKELQLLLANNDPELARLWRERKTFEEQFREEGPIDAETLATRALTNNLIVEREGAGVFVLRDGSSNRIVGRFGFIKDALDFLDQSGQAHGSNIGGGGIPPNFGSGLMPLPDGMPRFNEAPYMIRRDNLGEGFSDKFNIKTPLITPMRELFIAIDKQFGSKLFANVFEPVEYALQRYNAQVAPQVKELDKILKTVTKYRERRERIGGYLEAESPDRLRRNMTPLEVDIAEELAATQADMVRVIEYVRLRDKGANIKKLDVEANLGPAEKEAVKYVDQLRKGSGSLASVARLQRAILANTPDRAGYAAAHKLSSADVDVANKLLGFYDELGKRLGVNARDLIDLPTNTSLYYQGNFSAALRDMKLTDAQRRTLERLHQSGQLDPWEVDPFFNALRIIQADAGSTLLQPAIESARTVLKKESMDRIDPVAHRTIRQRVEQYLGDVQGHPSASRELTQEFVRRWNEKHRIQLPENVVHRLVTLVLQTGEAAAQGFRIAYAGLRDLYTPTSLYFAEFGSAATQRMLSYAAKGLDGLTSAELQAFGEIGKFDLTTIAAAEDFSNTVLGKGANILGTALNETNKLAFRLSGQGQIYSHVAAGVYLDRWKTSGELLAKLSRNEMTKDAVYKELRIQRYEPPVIEVFDRLVSESKYNEAAKFLGRQTIADITGTFTQGNKTGLQRNEFGRLAGQFGRWSSWFRTHVQSKTTRGTLGERLSYTARLASTQAALAATGAALGISVKNWFLPPAVAFAGGPSVEVAKTVYDAFFGSGIARNLAQANMKKWIGYDQSTGEFGLPDVWYPGRFFLKDLAEAMEMAQQGQQGAGLRALGYRPAPSR